jgi:hypothetical protein
LVFIKTGAGATTTTSYEDAIGETISALPHIRRSTASVCPEGAAPSSTIPTAIKSAPVGPYASDDHDQPLSD